MQVQLFTAASFDEYKYEKVAMRNGGDSIMLDKPRVYQLNDVVSQGWLTAPFGLSEPFGDSKKQQLAVLLTDPDIIAKFQELDNKNKSIIESNAKWFKGKKAPAYTPLLKTLDDGRIILNAKVSPDGRKSTTVWRGINATDGLAYEQGGFADLTRDASYAVRFYLWGMWMQPGNKCGMIANIDEVLVMPAAHDMRSTAPTLTIPGMSAAVVAQTVNVKMEDASVDASPEDMQV